MESKEFYHYKKIDGDKEAEIVLEIKTALGYSSVEPLIYDDDYLSLAESIMYDKDLCVVDLPTGRTKKKEVEKSILFWGTLGIKLHDVYVISNDLERVRKVHPSKIPVYYTKGNDAGLELITYSENSPSKETRAAIKSLFLPKRDKTFISVGSYNHEITHSQLISLKGSCEDYLNCEALPIFMEILFSDYYDKEENARDLLTRWRLMTLKDRIMHLYMNQDIKYGERITYDTYVQSIIEAISLANIYYGKSDSIRKEILGDVNKVFIGDTTVEGMLQKYDSDIDSVPKDLKVLRKTFPKK